MIRLDNVNRKVQIVLSGAITTSQLPVMVMYSDRTSTAYSGAAQLANTNSTTAVDICAAPAASTIRDIDYISVRNSDTVAATAIIRYNDNATLYTIVTVTLAVGDQLVYVHGDGWRVVDSTGQTKVSAATLIAASIVNTPAGSIAATNVQTAINELDTKKAALAGATFTGPVLIPAGSVSAPGLAVSGDTNTGVYSVVADELDVAAGGVSILRATPTVVYIGDTTSTAGTAVLRYVTGGTGAGLDGIKTSAVVANNSFFGVGAYGNDTTGEFIGATLNFKGEETWSATAHGTYLQFRTVAAGTTTLSEKMRLTSAGGLTLSAPTAGLGYGTGAGGAVTQSTSRTTGVTLNKVCGSITLVSAAGSVTWQTFTVTNSAVAATDTVIVNQKSGTDLNMIHVTAVAAGSFAVSFATTGGITTEQPVFNFAVIKAVAA